MDRLGEALCALQKDDITFREFYARTRTEWHRMAVSLYRNWTLPPGVTIDDVEQELLFGASLAVQKWQTGRASLRGFVVWNAHDKALKWIHRQRGCDQHTRKGPSEFARCVSVITRDDAAATHLLESCPDTSTSYEEAIDYETVLAELPDIATTEAGRMGLRAFIDAGGDLQRAAAIWHGDREARHLFKLRSEQHAQDIIKSEIRSARALLTEDGGVTW